jgi:hypothetical protein
MRVCLFEKLERFNQVAGKEERVDSTAVACHLLHSGVKPAVTRFDLEVS